MKFQQCFASTMIFLLIGGCSGGLSIGWDKPEDVFQYAKKVAEARDYEGIWAIYPPSLKKEWGLEWEKIKASDEKLKSFATKTKVKEAKARAWSGREAKLAQLKSSPAFLQFLEELIDAEPVGQANIEGAKAVLKLQVVSQLAEMSFKRENGKWWYEGFSIEIP